MRRILLLLLEREKRRGRVSGVHSEFKRAFFDEEHIFDVAEDCGIYMYGGMSVSIKEITDENCMKLEIE